jgi:GNAT superfamily N-acetyltransferase
MKLTIERLASLSQQDELDLAKIWPQQTVAQWRAWLDAPENRIFAARFNDRLLAAVKVSVTGENAHLNDFNVRELTRRRGVGLYLLEDTLRQMPDVTCWQVSDDGVDAGQRTAWGLFLQAVGFVPNAWGWEKRLTR